jgi:hypothetical protein
MALYKIFGDVIVFYKKLFAGEVELPFENKKNKLHT